MPERRLAGLLRALQAPGPGRSPSLILPGTPGGGGREERPQPPHRKKIRPARSLRGITREKVRPARGLHRCFRDKVRPAQPLLRCFREKTRPARHKPPILGHFSCAGRTISRSLPPPDQAGRTLYRTRGRCRYKTLPARSLGEPNRYKTLPARPKYPFSTHFAPAGRILYRFHHQYATQGEESHAPTRTSPHQRAPPPISHVIR